jgi:hypothetical protein
MFTEYAVFAKRRAHLFGDRHEQVVEHLQHDGIGGSADGFRRGEALTRSSTR